METLIGSGSYEDKFYMLSPYKQREVEKWRERIRKKNATIRQNKKDVFRTISKIFN